MLFSQEAVNENLLNVFMAINISKASKQLSDPKTILKFSYFFKDLSGEKSSKMAFQSAPVKFF